MTTGSQTIRTTPVAPPELHWAAALADLPRHAFPLVDGAKGIRALCGERWTAGFGKSGVGDCPECREILRAVLAGRVTI